MELITTFESLSKRVIEKYNDEIAMTMGILVADYRQTEAREYILNYMNRFDELSGKFIDFYLPGYYMYSCESKDEWRTRSRKNVCISRHCSSEVPVYISRLNENFYFDDYLFEDFLREFEKKTGISYVYGPMLILIEVKKGEGYGAIEFQDKLVIDLDDGTPRGVRRSGILFEQIFEIAKREVGLNQFAKEMTMHYIKGNTIPIIVKMLEGNLIESVVETIDGIKKYRVKKM